MSPRDLLCYRDHNFPHLPKKTFRSFVVFIFFLFWPIEREELVNLLCGIRRGECGVGLKIRIENVEEFFIDDPWLVVWTFKDEIEGVESAMMVVVVETSIDQEYGIAYLFRIKRQVAD